MVSRIRNQTNISAQHYTASKCLSFHMACIEVGTFTELSLLLGHVPDNHSYCSEFII